jgi:hypothetical protein
MSNIGALHCMIRISLASCAFALFAPTITRAQGLPLEVKSYERQSPSVVVLQEDEDIRRVGKAIQNLPEAASAYSLDVDPDIHVLNPQAA